MLLYTTITIVGTVASRSMNPALAGVIEAVVSGIVAAVIIAPFLSKKELAVSRFGVFMAVSAGIMIGLFTIAVLKSFSVNKVGVVAPVVLGGSIFLSTILSVYFFKEKITILQSVGLLLMGGGLLVLIYARAVGK